jgi:hypothetical protein
MAKAPVKPLLAIVGSTGTGKSDVCLINLELFRNQDMDLGDRVLINLGSWP